MKRLYWIVLVTLLMISHGAVAQRQKGPHGGQMALVGSHRFELVVGASNFSIYVMDINRKVLPLKGITGSALIHWNNDKNSATVPLVVEDDHLLGKMDLKKLGNAEVHGTIVIDGKQSTMAFEYPPE